MLTFIVKGLVIRKSKLQSIKGIKICSNPAVITLAKPFAIKMEQMLVEDQNKTHNSARVIVCQTSLHILGSVREKLSSEK